MNQIMIIITYKMVKHPKHKGSRFEILIYNDMKTYLTDVKRVGGSGTQGGENGDIIATINGKQFCIECKHYKKLTFSLIDKWWEKIKRQSKEINMSPLLIYRQNRQKIMVRTYMPMSIINVTVVIDMKYLVYKKVMKKCLGKSGSTTD